MELRTQRLFRMLLGAVTLAIAIAGLVTIVGVLNRGPDSQRFGIYVLFKDVQGLQVGSRVVHRGKRIGDVTSFELDAQAGRVRCLMTLEDDARELLASTSQFWIVRPRFAGIAGELSGLDTLIKESYVRLRVRSAGHGLEAGDELLGLEHPPSDLAEDDLDDAMVGDLLATCILPESHGLHSGSRVVLRGERCGEVRRVRLAKDGKSVHVRFRIMRAQRDFARETSRFWVARPILQGSLLTGMTVSSLSSLLGTALAFDSPRSGGEPLADDATVIGLVAPPAPDTTWDGTKVDRGTTGVEPGNRETRQRALSPWVKIRYRAIEQDTLSANDDVRARGEGVLFKNRDGLLCVLTARSACDGTFLIEGHWYDSVSIANERIRVVLADGRVWPARRAWVDPGDNDLAILRVQTPVNAPPAPLPEASSYLDFKQAGRSYGDLAARNAPFLIREADRAWGLVGQKKTKADKRVTVSFALVPETLRPEL